MNLVAGGGVLGGAPDTLVGARPEDLHITSGGGFPAEVAVAESLGSETVLSVRCDDGTRLAVRTGPRSPHRSGSKLTLSVDPDRRHVFDRATGQRR
jgi:ABC-type sugar transport system ATPase subunit